MDTRKNVKVHPTLKTDLSWLKLNLGLKTESEVLAYLVLEHHEMKDKLTYNQHRQLVSKVEQIHNQGAF